MNNYLSILANPQTPHLSFIRVESTYHSLRLSQTWHDGPGVWQAYREWQLGEVYLEAKLQSALQAHREQLYTYRLPPRVAAQKVEALLREWGVLGVDGFTEAERELRRCLGQASVMAEDAYKANEALRCEPPILFAAGCRQWEEVKDEVWAETFHQAERELGMTHADIDKSAQSPYTLIFAILVLCTAGLLLVLSLLFKFGPGGSSARELDAQHKRNRLYARHHDLYLEARRQFFRVRGSAYPFER